MKLRFEYKKIAPASKGKSAILRPIIPIELAAKNKTSVRYEALLDSGADMNMFQWEIAEVLELKKKNALEVSKFAGVSGDPIKAYYYNVVIIISGTYKHIARCGFTPDLPQVSHGFLGQQGFFNNYRVEFNLPKEIVRIRS